MVNFTETGFRLQIKKIGPLNQFAIAGADEKFVLVDVEIIGNDVFISSSSIANSLFLGILGLITQKEHVYKITKD